MSAFDQQVSDQVAGADVGSCLNTASTRGALVTGAWPPVAVEACGVWGPGYGVWGLGVGACHTLLGMEGHPNFHTLCFCSCHSVMEPCNSTVPRNGSLFGAQYALFCKIPFDLPCMIPFDLPWARRYARRCDARGPAALARLCMSLRSQSSSAETPQSTPSTVVLTG